MNDAETIKPPFDPAVLYKALFLAIMATFVLVPLLATVLGGFKSLGELRVNPFGWPQHWEWSNYGDILVSKRYWQLLRNSLVISTLTVTLTLIVASMAAFTFAHIKFYGSSMLLSYLTLGPVVPGRDRRAAAVHQGARSRTARHLFRRRAAAGGVQPRDEHSAAAAFLQGPAAMNCWKPLWSMAAAISNFFRYVTLPLSRPILATVGTIAFVNSWNAYLLPLVMLNTDDLYPWPLGIMVYQGEYSSEWHLILAFVTLTILPTIILFLFAQKHIVAGLTAGAVKG